MCEIFRFFIVETLKGKVYDSVYEVKWVFNPYKRGDGPKINGTMMLIEDNSSMLDPDTGIVMPPVEEDMTATPPLHEED